MPGSSLWLVPPTEHPLHKLLSDIISHHLPAQFPELTGPTFSPHMTLTSNIDPKTYGDDPQGWLDSIAWPDTSTVHVRLQSLKTEDVFFRRSYLKVEFEGVREAAGVARARGVIGEDSIGPATESWLREWNLAFGPHVSLIYGSVPIEDGKLAEIETLVRNQGVKLSSQSPVAGSFSGWDGGIVWLVPTDRSIDEWKPIATRQL
ncbi:2',3'-cyclic-nucleotide 3'-phosphodiesterase [Stachybotrys elegans]|uniref:2',3'-cyclic-nucleotide 3'-phosphodiesterase n=1 Tax=Stachybotrys elegans TaxID=80388 RepID=A0A8K0SG64_9HYPO|nr:2',3'-cyclic-nucleotide 3'-phosphodiesterase [Stachybotrys elegans]